MLGHSFVDNIKEGDIFTNFTYKELHFLGIKLSMRGLYFHIRDGFQTTRPCAIVMSFFQNNTLEN